MLCSDVRDWTLIDIWFPFLHAKAATALACLSHHNSGCPSVCHVGGSVKNGAS